MEKNGFKLDKILRVDLTTGTIKTEKMSDGAASLIGGKGLALHYLLKEQKPKTDPLSPENMLIFAWGPFPG